MPEAVPDLAEAATATAPAARPAPSLCLAFDFGLRRIGVAHGSRLLQQASPLMVIDQPDNAGRFAAIDKLLREWQPDACVVGLPLHPDGAEHDMTRRARRFANQLHGRFALPVWLVDERYSSAVLNGRRGQVIDAAAAAIILEQFWQDPARAVAAGPAVRSAPLSGAPDLAASPMSPIPLPPIPILPNPIPPIHPLSTELPIE
jgi:putative Holliday junction resolvase